MKALNFFTASRPSGPLGTASLTLAAILLTGSLVWSQPPAGGGSGRGGRGGSGRGGGGGGLQADAEHPVMKIGTHIPDFTLPGADGKMHSLKEWAGAKLLIVAFECNHCPESQNYEGRIKKLYEDYKPKGVQLIAINPNNPASVRLDELGYTDIEDSLPEMKIRLADRHISWPYLYDGETQSTATKFGVIATPHIFIFDKDRNLQFNGQIDDNQNEAIAKTHETRDALDALLAGKPVPAATTRVHGCSTKWLSKAVGSQSREAEMQKIMKEPIKLDTADADAIKKLTAPGQAKVQVVTFYSTKCTTCADSFHDLETTYRMFRQRAFVLETVATDPASDKDAVNAFLQKQYASSPNLQSTATLAATQAAAGEKWKANSMFTEVIDTDGKVVFKKEGKLALNDLLLLRRHVLAAMPDTRAYPGNHAYWAEEFKAAK